MYRMIYQKKVIYFFIYKQAHLELTTQSDLELLIPLAITPEYWDYRHAPPSLVYSQGTT